MTQAILQFWCLVTALDALKQWWCQSTLPNGGPVEVEATTTVGFVLGV